jgi:hypothetical protein
VVVVPIGSNGQEFVEKDGVLRDPKTNIVLARRHPHPFKDELNAIPSETGVNFDIPDEMKQLIMIHLVDNRGWTQTGTARYEYVPPSTMYAVNGRAAVGTWEPPVKGRKTAKEAEPEQAVVVPDATGWSPKKIAAMEAQLKAEKNRRAMIFGADAGVAADLAAAEGLDYEGVAGDLT